MHELNEFGQTLNLIISVIAGVVTVFPFWISVRASVGERWLFGMLAGALTFLILPDQFTQCSDVAAYRLWAIVAFVFALLFAAIYLLLHRRHSYSQTVINDDARVVNVIIGGGPLTAEASAFVAAEPDLNIQQVLDHFDGDPDRVWPRRSRSYFVLLHRVTAFGTGLSIVALITCVTVSALLAKHATNVLSKYSLVPSQDQTVRQPRISIPIKAILWECDDQLTWTIDGPEAIKSRREIVGEVSESGNYFAPPTITEDIDLYVVATPPHHSDGRRQVKIQLRTHPPYSRPIYADIPDINHKQVSLVIEVLDKRYSWHIGENWLDGPLGSTLMKKMANDGVFTGMKQIIAIGAASREYTVLNGDARAAKAREDARSLDRAQVLGRWIRDALEPGQTPIWALKVGRYDEEDRLSPQETAPERQLVIVGVIKAEPGIDMLSAVRNAFEAKRFDEPVLGRYLDKYPLANWRIVPVAPVD
jgi:hypothetical protein